MSSGVGSFAGAAETGIEMTDLNTAAIGSTTSFRRKQSGTGNYLWAPAQAFYNNSQSRLAGSNLGPTVNARSVSNCWPGTTSARSEPESKELTADVRWGLAGKAAPTLLPPIARMAGNLRIPIKWLVRMPARLLGDRTGPGRRLRVRPAPRASPSAIGSGSDSSR